MVNISLGVRLLDQKVPGWDRRIDLDRLDMSYPFNHRPASKCCVLAQLFGSYVEGLIALGQHSGAGLGFNYEDGGNYSYRDLDAAWTAEILSRRSNERQADRG